MIKALLLSGLASLSMVAGPVQAGLDTQWGQQSQNQTQAVSTEARQCDELFSRVNFQTGYPDLAFAVRGNTLQGWKRGNHTYQQHNCQIGDRIILGRTYTTMSRRYGTPYSEHMYKVENGVLFLYLQYFNKDGSKTYRSVSKSAIGFSCPQGQIPAMYRGQSFMDWSETQSQMLQGYGTRGRGGFATCRNTGAKFNMGNGGYQDNGQHKDGTTLGHFPSTRIAGDF
jgi:hypothetical protein